MDNANSPHDDKIIFDIDKARQDGLDFVITLNNYDYEVHLSGASISLKLHPDNIMELDGTLEFWGYNKLNRS